MSLNLSLLRPKNETPETTEMLIFIQDLNSFDCECNEESSKINYLEEISKIKNILVSKTASLDGLAMLSNFINPRLTHQQNLDIISEDFDFSLEFFAKSLISVGNISSSFEKVLLSFFNRFFGNLIVLEDFKKLIDENPVIYLSNRSLEIPTPTEFNGRLRELNLIIKKFQKTSVEKVLKEGIPDIVKDLPKIGFEMNSSGKIIATESPDRRKKTLLEAAWTKETIKRSLDDCLTFKQYEHFFKNLYSKIKALLQANLNMKGEGSLSKEDAVLFKKNSLIYKKVLRVCVSETDLLLYKMVQICRSAIKKV